LSHQGLRTTQQPTDVESIKFDATLDGVSTDGSVLHHQLTEVCFTINWRKCAYLYHGSSFTRFTG